MNLFFCYFLRRTFCNQILQIVKDYGAFSTMHTFLVYLQMAPMEQQPAVASLLLQLDLLVCFNILNHHISKVANAFSITNYNQTSTHPLIMNFRLNLGR